LRLRFGARGRALNLRRGPAVDLSAYAGAFGLLARSPSIFLAPLVAALLQTILMVLAGSMSGGGIVGSLNGSLAQLIAQLVNSVGLAVAVIGADFAWRRGRAGFSEAWDDARRKLPDILMAALGLNFLVFVALQIGSMFLGGIGGLVLGAIALFFFIYTIPAAAIGGIPGSGSLQVSLERVRANPIPTALLYVVYVFTFFIVSGIASTWLLEWLVSLGVPSSNVIAELVAAAVQAILSGYIACVMAKTYADISYGRRWG